jgi:hypothetical protein
LEVCLLVIARSPVFCTRKRDCSDGATATHIFQYEGVYNFPEEAFEKSIEKVAVSDDEDDKEEDEDTDDESEGEAEYVEDVVSHFPPMDRLPSLLPSIPQRPPPPPSFRVLPPSLPPSEPRSVAPDLQLQEGELEDDMEEWFAANGEDGEEDGDASFDDDSDDDDDDDDDSGESDAGAASAAKPADGGASARSKRKKPSGGAGAARGRARARVEVEYEMEPEAGAAEKDW